MEEQPPEVRQYGLALLAVVIAGVVLRGLHLDIPMRYDETVTYTSYASKGWRYVTTHYQNPNNHVLHSVLVGWATAWLGNAPAVIRLPAFLAGCALVPATAWVGRLAHGKSTALVSAALVATSPVLIEFSTNARGYSLLGLCVVLATGIGLSLANGRGWVAWLALIEVGVIGFYTIPIMAIPWAGITAWLVVLLYRHAASPRERARRIALLAGANLVVAAVVVALYSGIVLHEGLDALIGNRFVAPEPARALLAGTPRALAGIVRHWTTGVPLVLSVPAGIAAATGWWLRRRSDWSLLLVALAVGALIGMGATRNWGEPRIWLWMLPIVSITSGIGVSEVVSRTRPRRGPVLALGIASGWALVMSVQILVADPVRASRETGAFPEGEEVFSAITERYRQGDAIVGDFVDVEPLRFYLARWTEAHDPPARSPLDRIWVVVDGSNPERADQVRARLLRMGGPPLEASNPVFRDGEVSVYLFGRPAGSPDARLLEAIDWYTGVAGHVDEARALGLISQVADERDSPLARGWLARCRRIGCLGFSVAPDAAADSDELVSRLRELALAAEPEAEFLVGFAYQDGWGVPPDPEQAVEWYRRAASAGHVLAERTLGDAYASGAGVESDDSAAVAWWRRAAEAGDAQAQLELGRAYEEGRGISPSSSEAARWYETSADRGNTRAVAALRRLNGG